MIYFEELKKMAQISFDRFMLYVNEHTNLYIRENETENKNIEIEVTDIDENFNEELVGRFYFNENEDFITSYENNL